MTDKVKPQKVADLEPIAVSIADAAKALGISNWNCYQLCDQGVLEARYIGRRRLVSYASLQAYFASRPTVPEKSA